MLDYVFNKDRLRIMLGVWLGVYPSVVLLTYLMQPLGWPLWLSTLLSTATTIPLITFVVVPLSKQAVAVIDDRPPEEIEG